MGLTGELLQDTYQVQELLGRGGMGEVYEATHARLDRRFAIKILRPSYARSPQAFARFRREAMIASSLGHPHIVQVVDFNTLEDGSPYIVMEHLVGEDLDERLRALGRTTIEQALRVADQVGSALAAAHAKDVVHRDLKPENIFLCEVADDDWYVKILDFGISKIKGSTSIVTQDETVIGTPNYMSPEQADARSDLIDARTDQFALATIVYEMLAGHNPFAAESVPSVLYRVVHSHPPLLHEVRDDVPAELGIALARGMAKSRDARYPDIRSFVRALRGMRRDVATSKLLAKPVGGKAKTVPQPIRDQRATDETALASRDELGGRRENGARADWEQRDSQPTVDASDAVDAASGSASAVGSATAPTPATPGLATPAPVPPATTSTPVAVAAATATVAPRGGARGRWLLLAAGLLVGSGVGLWLATRGSSAPGASPPGAAEPSPAPSPASVDGPASATADHAPATEASPPPDTPPAAAESTPPPPPPPPVVITLSIEPAPDTVLVDGRAVDGARVELEPDGASHTIAVDKQGFVREEVTVVADRDQTLRMRLAPAPAPQPAERQRSRRTRRNKPANETPPDGFITDL